MALRQVRANYRLGYELAADCVSSLYAAAFKALGEDRTRGCAMREVARAVADELAALIEETKTEPARRAAA